VIDELVFVIETDNFPAVVNGYGVMADGPRVEVSATMPRSLFRQVFCFASRPSGRMGFHMVDCTGSESHLRNSQPQPSLCATLNIEFPFRESSLPCFGLQYIEPELREATMRSRKRKRVPYSVSNSDGHPGELHAHSLSSDGGSIEAMGKRLWTAVMIYRITDTRRV